MCQRVGVLGAVIVLALGAAACFGLASVLQHHAVGKEPMELSMRAGLLVRLARQPLWLLANVLDAAGFACQFLALRHGSLALVNPLLVCSLIFALPAGALISHHRISRTEYLAALVVAGGLGLFMAVARPGPGRPFASDTAWVVLSGVVVAVIVCMLIAARGPAKRFAAVLLAAAAGLTWGYVSAVSELAGHLLDRGVVYTLESWTPYVMIASGAIGILMVQSAFQAGALRMSLPTLTVMEPLVAIAIGQVLFGERIDSHGLAVAWQVVGLAIMTVGVFVLARPEAEQLEHAVD